MNTGPQSLFRLRSVIFNIFASAVLFTLSPSINAQPAQASGKVSDKKTVTYRIRPSDKIAIRVFQRKI